MNFLMLSPSITMLLYKIDPTRVASAVTPILLERMVQLFASADRIIVY